jgi:hypothetical protein
LPPPARPAQPADSTWDHTAIAVESRASRPYEVAEQTSTLKFEARSQQTEVRNMARFVNLCLLASSFWLWRLRFSAGAYRTVMVSLVDNALTLAAGDVSTEYTP